MASANTPNTLYALTEEIIEIITNVVIPLLPLTTFSDHLQCCLSDLENDLVIIRTDIFKWKETRRSHQLLASWAVSRELKDNKECLIRHYTILTNSVQIFAHANSYNLVIPTPDIRLLIENKSAQKMKMKVDEADEPSLFEVNEFWKCHVGDESEFAASEEFCSLLSAWLDEDISETARKRLLLRLDQNHTGYISFSTFQSFISNGKLRETIHRYSSDPHLPLLIWIEDDASGVIPQVLEATAMGISIVQLSSTSSTKRWITVYKDFLKKHDDPSEIRIIANQLIYERNSSHAHAYNESAGNEITAYVRQEGINVPILIYTTKLYIPLTRYVNDYDLVGSVGGTHIIFLTYISGLAHGRRDDMRWMRYDA
ncbi:hypothetical protein BDZ97DRAFT_1810235 [Flammula alnicola]|nr:hypothetical protein BDZ97DRAFT_1810235 [Flammula alnicola]